MPSAHPQQSGAASFPRGQPRTWRSWALNLGAMLAYFALVILLQYACAQVVPLAQQLPVVIVASTIILAAALAPLLFLVRRDEHRPTPHSDAASVMTSATALLGAVGLAIPIYLVSAVVLHWAAQLMASSSRALPSRALFSTALALATLVALVYGATVFSIFCRARQTGGRQ